MNGAYFPFNVLDPHTGARCSGNASYTDGIATSGNDDAGPFQALCDAAAAADGVPIVVVPNRRVYAIGSTITIPAGLTILGYGGRSPTGTSQPATFVWTGASGGTMFDVAHAAQNIPCVGLENICLTGRTDGTNPPATLLKYRGTGGGGNVGSVDTGSYLRNVWFQKCSGDAVRLEGGATNFLIENGRWDNWGGYAIYATGDGISLTIDGNSTMAMGAAANGMLFLDGETAGTSIVRIVGLHMETNASLNETFAGGTNPFDRRGLIRLGVDATESALQHRVHCLGLELAEPFSISSHCVFQVTATTTADSNMDNTRMVQLAVVGGMGVSRGTSDSGANDEIRLLGGRVHANERPTVTASGNIGYFELNIGKNTAGDQGWSWINSRNYILRTPVIQPTTVAQLPTDFPKEGQVGYVTDSNSTTLGATVAGGGSNKVQVMYNGTNWKITAVVN